MVKMVRRIVMISLLSAILMSVVRDISFAKVGIHGSGYDASKKDGMSYREAMDYEREHLEWISGVKAYCHFITNFADYGGGRLLIQKLQEVAICFVGAFLLCLVFWRWNFKYFKCPLNSLEDLERAVDEIRRRVTS